MRMLRKRNGRSSGEGARRLRCGLALVGLVAGLLFPATGSANPAADLQVMVVHITNEPGAIDPRAGRLHAELRDQYRYESLRVVTTRELRLDLNQSGGFTLPTGRELRLTPMAIDDKGALLAVDLHGLVQTDLRLAPGHLVVIGAEMYEGGRMVVTLELRR